jgi:uncharacterized membrane protein YdjX (TVP38/TMEM64 family)
MKRALMLTALVASGIVGLKLLVENVLGLDLTPIVEAWVLQPGTSSALTVVILLAADVFLPVPSSLIMILSGAVFGVVWGSLLSLVGSIGGEWLGFELARKYGDRLSSRMLSDDELRRLTHLFARSGAATVFITRALPIVMETVSIVAGLSRMRRTAFLAASLAGTLPIVVVYAYAGAVSRQTGSLIPGVIMLIAVTGAGWLWYQAQGSRLKAQSRLGSSPES